MVNLYNRLSFWNILAFLYDIKLVFYSLFLSWFELISRMIYISCYILHLLHGTAKYTAV